MNKSKLYEKKLTTTYSDLVIKKKNSWSLLKYKSKNYHLYTDEKYINMFFTKHILSLNKKELNIIDIGGGDGVLLSIIGKQLEKKNIKINLLNIDDNNKSLEICNRKFPNIETRKQDITTIKDKNIADVVVCRFVVQYLSKEKQNKLLSVINGLLKNGGLLLASWPFNENEKEYNEIMADIKAVISGEKPSDVAKNIYHFQSQGFIDLLKKNNYTKIITENAGSLTHTAESWKDRFNIGIEQTNKINKILSKYLTVTKGLVSKKGKEVYIKSQIAVVRAYKI